jgi:hypothetical protein
MSSDGCADQLVDAAHFLYQKGFLRSCNEPSSVDQVEQYPVLFVMPQLAIADGHMFPRVQFPHALLRVTQIYSSFLF